MRIESDIQKDIETTQALLDQFMKELHQARKWTRVPCSKCGVKTLITVLTYTQTH